MSRLAEKVLFKIGFEPAIEYVKDKWNYFWNYKSYVKKLENECKYLEYASDAVKHEVEEGKNNGCDTEMEVEEWFKDVIEVTKEARGVQVKKKQKSCFRGSTIINPRTRYKIGKEAEETRQTIQELETIKSGFRRIYYRNAPGTVTGSSHRGISYYPIPSRDAMLEAINKALKDPDVKRVGVYGPSGVGKSTLLTQIVEQVHTRSLNYDFDKVAMATVSRDPDLQKIQGELAYSLGVKFDDEINVKQKADRLRDRLRKENKIVIILDDLHRKLELGELGIPDEHKGVKLVLTSRLEETLKNEMYCGHNFELKALSKEEAIDLFKTIVGRQIEDESLLELVGRAVEECACLPVYIVPLATKLKTCTPSSWKKDIENLMQSNKLGIDKLILEALKDEEAKILILLCGQVGNQIIAIEDLLIYGMGLGLFQGIKSLGEGRERLKTLLENLKSLCFLKNYGDDHVKIHDLMSDASLSIASKTQHALVLRNGKDLRDRLSNKEVIEKCKSISLPFVDGIIGELPASLEGQELIMFLSYTDGNCQIQFPDSFFEKAKKLKVLDLFGASFTSLPSSIKHIEGLLTLSLDHCEIKDLKTIGKLEKLQVLTLRGSNIDKLPKEVGKLTDLRLLDLSRCFKLEIIENGALSGLVNLEELHLPEHYQDWDAKAFDKASLEELTGLSHLTSLSICICDLTNLPHGFPFANLKRFKIVIKSYLKYMTAGENVAGENVEKINPRRIGEASQESATKTNEDYLIEYDRTRTLRLKLDVCDWKILLEDWVQTALQTAKKLELVCWREYEKSITELSKRGFSELKHINVKDSPGIQYVFRPKDRFASAMLESLRLERLQNLESIYDGNLLTSSFINLKILRIKACHKLQNLFSPSMAKGLSRIEEIELIDCNNLSGIVAFDGVGPTPMERERRKGAKKIELLVFKGLHKLVLSGLPKFSSFCTKESQARGDQDGVSLNAFLDGLQVSILSLESLTLSGLPNLRKMSEGKFPVKLQCLQLLEVKSCENLSNVLENNLQLKNLEVLTIEKCASIETIFDLKKSSQGEAIESEDLAKLIKLKLIELENLKTIWPMNNKEGLLGHNLNQLEISYCQNLTHLFSPSMVKSMQKISQISIDHCNKMETIFTEGNDSAGIEDNIRFSSLIELRIFDMECLTKFASGNCYFNFPCLKKLEIHNCPNMSTFVPAEYGGKSSSCVKNLITRACPGISKALPAEQHDGGAESKPFFSTTVILPSLEKLVLSSLGCFTSVWQSIVSEDSFCKLASIEIEKCNFLQMLVSLEHGQQDLQETTLSNSQVKDAKIMINSSRKPVLKFPFLTNIKIDKCDELRSLFPDTIARNLFELEYLHILSCKKMVEVVSTQKQEMMMLNKLCSLKLEYLQELKGFSTGSAEYYFPFLQELWISGCTNFKSFITSPPNSSTDANVKSTPLFHDKVIIPNLEALHIKGLGLEDLLLDDFPPRLFCKLKELRVEACHELSTVIPPFILPNMQSLESLTVKNCESVKVIFEFKGHTFVDRKLTNIKSWKMKTMKLYHLPQLEHIYGDKTISEYCPFNDFDIIEVQSCKLLRSVFTVSTPKTLEKLQKLTVEDCESMEQVVDFKYGQDCSIRGTNKIILCQLSFLKLSKLQRLSSFCSKLMTEWPSLVEMEVKDWHTVEAFAVDSEQHLKALFLLEKVAFPRIKSLKISHMLNMKELWSINEQRIDSECSSEAFSKLKTFEIKKCQCLKTIFPCKMLGGFSKLETLIVDDCDSLEQVFQVQGFRSGTECNSTNSSIRIPFSLMELKISRLPAMNHVWDVENSEGIDLACEMLKIIEVKSCDSLKHLFPASIARCLGQMDDIDIRACKDMEEIVQRKVCSIDDDYDDKEHHRFIPNLKVTYLALQNLPELKSFIPCDCEDTVIRDCPKAKVHASSIQEMSGGCNIIKPVEKVNIPRSSFKNLYTDMGGLQELQFLDGLANLSKLSIRKINDAEAKRFPWKNLLKRLHNLETLMIDDSSMEELFLSAHEEAQEEEEQEEIAPYDLKQEHYIHLQSLKSLKLVLLNKLKRVWREASVVEEVLDIVQHLIISYCNSLKHLFKAPASFRNLALIEVGWCNEMEYLLTSSAARCLKQVSILKVWICKQMREIVREDQEQNGTGGGGVGKICFPTLKVLQLYGLEELRSFCSSTSHSFQFPSLESLFLEKVHKLETFCRGGFSAPLLHKIYTSREEVPEGIMMTPGIKRRLLDSDAVLDIIYS